MMTLKKGFLRENTFKPTVSEWLMAGVIFLVSSFFLYLLIIYAYQSLLFSFTRYFVAQYRYESDQTEIYSWFIASFSTVSGLNWAMAFLLRNRLNGRPSRNRFGLRIAYHYMGLNVWGYMAWLTRLLYQLVFLEVIFFVDSIFDPGIDYKWFLVLLIVKMFLSTWLMAHRFLKKDYFKYLSLSSISLLFAFVLMALKPIDFTHYNRMVKKQSVFSGGDFYVPKVNTLSFEPRTYNSIALFVYGDKGQRLPVLRSRKWGRYRFVTANYVADQLEDPDINAAVMYVNQEVTLGQIWRLEDELRSDNNPIILHYRAEATFESWSSYLFSYRWNSESRFLAPCELNDPAKPEGAACRGLVTAESPNVLHIEYSEGLAMIDNKALNMEKVLYRVTRHLEEFKGKSLILIEPDLSMTFEAYTLFKDQIKSHIVMMRTRYLDNKYQMTYDYHSAYGYYQSRSEQVKEAEQEFPMAIINLNNETGKMFSDTHD